MTTPLQLTATSGLLINQGLVANTQMTANIVAYENFANGVIQSIIQGSKIANIEEPNVTVLSSVTLSKLRTIGTGTCIGLADGVPPGYNIANSNTVPGLTGQIKIGYTTVLPADLSKFCQAFTSALGFVDQTNQTINVALNSQSFLGPTFAGMNDLTTGSVSGISSDLRLFSVDAGRLGSVIALQALDQLGSPALLLSQIIAAGGLTPGLITQLETRGVLPQAQSLGDPSVQITDSVQAIFYEAMQQVRGDDLSIVLDLLDCTTSGITTLADLLNPFLIFPTSRRSLTCPLPAATQRIYLDDSGSVNTNILPELPDYLVSSTSSGMPYERLRAIIPPDQALANKALQLALQQVKGVQNLQFPDLGRTAAALQLDTDLPLINNLQQAVPPGVANTVLSSVAKGTGPEGKLNLGDVLGTASGFNINRPLANVINVINTIPTGYLELTYDVMANVISGAYGPPTGNIDIPSGLPGAGMYSDGDEAYTVLCDIANSTISNLAASYPTQISSVNSDWTLMANTVSNQNTNLVAATIDYPNIVSSTTVVFSFATELEQYGQDTRPGGAAEYLTSIANISNIYGQSIEAALREGRNMQALDAAGLTPDNKIPTQR